MTVIQFPRRATDEVVTDAAALGTVLGVWAHPDDEALVRDWWSTETFVSADAVAGRSRDRGTWQVAA